MDAGQENIGALVPLDYCEYNSCDIVLYQGPLSYGNFIFYLPDNVICRTGILEEKSAGVLAGAIF